MSATKDRATVSRRDRIRHDLPASLVVFLVALPLCMGIAIASGAPIAAGLVTGIIGGLVTGLLAGAPLQVSGPAAGLTVIVYECIQRYGLEQLGVVVLFAGGFQFLAALFRIGRWFRAVSPAVVQGMLAGIGILIACSQFHVMVDDKPRESGLSNLLSVPGAVAKTVLVPTSERGAQLSRSARARMLYQASLLHLQQAEIAESVHHLAVEFGEPAPDSADVQASSAAVKSVGLVSSDDRAAQRAAAERLRQFLPAQNLVVSELEALAGMHGADLVRTALHHGREALADLEAGNAIAARRSQDQAVAAIAELRDSMKSRRFAAGIGLLTIGLLLVWQGAATRGARFIPAPLVAVAAATIATVCFSVPVLRIEIPDSLLEEVYFPSWAEIKGITRPELLLMAVQIAVIASAESLLCATAVDQLHRGPPARYDKELFAQGVGNMLCGLVSALPMTGVIVRSSANVNAGAATRCSAVLHGLWLLLFVAAFSFLLRLIPTASLAAILVYTGCKLVDLNAIRTLWNRDKGEAAILLATMVAVVVANLLTGVLLGIFLSIAELVYTFAKLRIRVEHPPRERRATIVLRGSATFLMLPKLAGALEEIPAGTEVHAQTTDLVYIDHACLDLLANWQKRHESTGGRLMIDRDLPSLSRVDHSIV